MLYVLNLGEEEAGSLHEREEEYRNGPLAGRANTAVAGVCGKIEAELAELPRDEQRDYLASYGLAESGLERLITRDLFPARPDEFPDRRRGRVPRVDHPDEQHAPSRPPARSTPISKRSSSAPKWSTGKR